MSAKLNALVVKDTGSKFTVYTGMPEGVVAPDLYTKLDKATSKAVVKAMQGFRGGYTLTSLRSGGRVTLGRKNTLKKQLRSIIKNGAATPGTEVNSMQAPAPTQNSGRPAKGSAEAKEWGRKMAAARAAKKGNNGSKNASAGNTTLVLSASDSSTSKLDAAIANAREYAKDTGDFELLTILLDRKYS